MGLLFRKRIKIAPGIFINLSKSGASFTIGPKGANVNIGKNSAYVNTGIPGTGLYSRSKITHNTKRSNTSPNQDLCNSNNNKFNMIPMLFLLLVPISLLLVHCYKTNEGVLGALIFMCFIFVVYVIIKNLFFIPEINYKSRIKNLFVEEFLHVKEDAEIELEKWKNGMKGCDDPTTLEYFDCFVENYVSYRLKSLVSKRQYKKDDFVRRIDKVIIEISERLIENGKIYFSDIIDCHNDYNAIIITIKDLVDCGFAKFEYDSSSAIICDIPSRKMAKKLIKKIIKNNWQSFLSEDDKKELNDFFIYFSRKYVNEIKYRTINIDFNSDMRSNYELLSQCFKKQNNIYNSYWSIGFLKTRSQYTYGTLTRQSYFEYSDIETSVDFFREDNLFFSSLPNKMDILTINCGSSYAIGILPEMSICIDYNNYKIYINNSSYITTPYKFSNKYNSLLTYKEKMFFLNLKGTNVFEDYFQYELHLSPRIVFKLYIPIDHNSNNGNLRLYTCINNVLEPKREFKTNKNIDDNKDVVENTIIYDDKDNCCNDVTAKNGLIQILDELNSLIGLQNVKERVNQLVNYISIQQKRKTEGLKTTELSYHCVFTGNPGSGKTTVARIVANIYHELGILEKGHLIETDRAGLVAEYVGQTAVKTNKIIDSALDGVLFVDEAYSLIQGGDNDFGREAISTLLKRMEDDRNRLVVILAGYNDEMKLFIDSNPGLQSRFNNYIQFNDYSEEELFEIFIKMTEENDYKVDSDAIEKLHNIFHKAYLTKDKQFGNARYVRNLFENALQKQATRLSASKDIDKGKLMSITKDDL